MLEAYEAELDALLLKHVQFHSSKSFKRLNEETISGSSVSPVTVAAPMTSPQPTKVSKNKVPVSSNRSKKPDVIDVDADYMDEGNCNVDSNLVATPVALSRSSNIDVIDIYSTAVTSPPLNSTSSGTMISVAKTARPATRGLTRPTKK